MPTELPADPEPEPDNVVYLAYVDGVPVARASGVVLGAWRRALRRRDAARGARARRVPCARRGTLGGRGRPRHTRASSPRPVAMSRPILAQLGFREVCEIRILLDSFGREAGVRVSAKADYAIRAVIELAAAGDGPVKGERIAQAQEIPVKFLENILVDLRNAGIVRSRRGADGGYWLARPAAEITLADVIRAVDGPLANVRGLRSEERRVRRAAPSRCARCGSPCARACAACSSRSRSPTSPRGELPANVERSPPTPTPGCRTNRRGSDLHSLFGSPPFAAGAGLCPAGGEIRSRWRRSRKGGPWQRNPWFPSESCFARRPDVDDLAALELEPLGLVAGQLHREPLAVVADQLDPHLEAEVDDPLDHRLAVVPFGSSVELEVVRAHPRSRRTGSPGRRTPSRTRSPAGRRARAGLRPARSRPWFMTTTSSATSIASSWSCVTNTVVVCVSSCRRRSQTRSSARTRASSAPNGSSSSSTFGSSASARASAMRWRWPPESCAGIAVCEALELHERRAARRRASRISSFGRLRIFSPNATLSRTVMCLKAA